MKQRHCDYCLKDVSIMLVNVAALLFKGVVRNCHHFQKSTQSTLGGGGQWPQNAFQNYDALPFHTGSLKSTSSKYSFGRRGSQKRVGLLCVRF